MSDSKIIAIDIVLLPPEEIWNWAVEISRQLNEQKLSSLQLDDTHFPHITIVQLFAEVDRLNELYSTTEKTVLETRPLPLEVIGMEVEDKTAGFKIGLTESLEKIFNQLMASSEPFVVESDPESFLLDEGQKASPGTINWVTNFRKLDAYKPHISLSKNVENIPMIEPSEFIADRFAICHLGNNCTCRKILKEWKLSN